MSGDGKTVRFASDDDALRQPDGSLARAHVVYLQHASDPIVGWSPDLIVRKPDWLEEPRGPDVISEVHYFPLVTFRQVTCDMIAATAPPAGHGHTYGTETIDLDHRAAPTELDRRPDQSIDQDGDADIFPLR